MKTKWLTIAFAAALIINHAVGSQVPDELAVNNLQVVDKNNKSLGTAYVTSRTFLDESAVVMKVDEHFVLITVASDGFRETRANVGFETTDCSGTPYLISAEPQFLLSLGAVTAPGNTLWVPSGEAPRGIFRESILVRPDEYRPNGCYATGTQVELATPARVAVQLDELFVPPFSLRSFSHIHRQTKRTFTGPALQR